MIDTGGCDDRTSESSVDRVTAGLRREIVAGRLAPGQDLSQRRLAQMFDVSFIPVREALRILAAEGLVRTRCHGGAFVAPLSRVELVGIIRLMTTLIPGIATRIDTDRDRLDRLAVRLADCAAAPGHPAAGYEHHHSILIDLISIPGSRSETNLVLMLCRNLERYLRADGDDHEAADCAAYNQMLDALLAARRTGEPDRILTLTQQHLHQLATTANDRGEPFWEDADDREPRGRTDPDPGALADAGTQPDDRLPGPSPTPSPGEVTRSF